MVEIDWQNNSLIPVIAQSVSTKEVLMLAYANKEALDLTLQTGFAHYFSRSRNRIWKKGEESGHLQKIAQVLSDCDGDAILYMVEQQGVACHTGRSSCFFNDQSAKQVTQEVQIDPINRYNIIDLLYLTVQERKTASSEKSYVASLYSKGENSILKKVVEEAGEFCFAIKDGKADEIVYEAADLIFHMIVTLGYKNIPPDLIMSELKRRVGTSGIEEKKSRSN